MDILDLREFVSAGIHGVAFTAAVPATYALARRAGRGLPRVGAILAYGGGLAACFAASTACHSLSAIGQRSTTAILIDHAGIYLLIAGTYTPIIAALMPAKGRAAALRLVWMAASLGIGLNLACGPLPAWLATSFYLVMGWGGLWCYRGLRPILPLAELAAVPIGGILYSIGALFHVVRRPVILAGVFEAHELFHVLVVAGALSHFLFLWRNLPGTTEVGTTHHARPKFLSRPTAGRDAAGRHLA